MGDFRIQKEICQYESSVYGVNMEVWRNDERYVLIQCSEFDSLSVPQKRTMEIDIYDVPAIHFGLHQMKQIYPSVEYITITDKAFLVTSNHYTKWLSLVSYGILYHEKSWWEHWFHGSLLEESDRQSYDTLRSRLRDPRYKPPFHEFLGWLCPESEDMPYFEAIYTKETTLFDVFSQIHSTRRGLFSEWKLRIFFQLFADFRTLHRRWKIPLNTPLPEDTYSLIGPIETLVF